MALWMERIIMRWLNQANADMGVKWRKGGLKSVVPKGRYDSPMPTKKHNVSLYLTFPVNNSL